MTKDAQIMCQPTIAHEYSLAVKSHGSAAIQHTESSVVYIPPLFLQVKRSQGYPSNQSPHFRLGSDVLTSESVSRLIRGLRRLWLDSEGMEGYCS